MTLNEKLEAYLRANTGKWIRATAFEAIAGRQAWRTRISDLRIYRGMDIKNRQRCVGKTPEGRRIVISEYRYVPVSLFEVAGL